MNSAAMTPGTLCRRDGLTSQRGNHNRRFGADSDGGVHHQEKHTGLQPEDGDVGHAVNQCHKGQHRQQNAGGGADTPANPGNQRPKLLKCIKTDEGSAHNAVVQNRIDNQVMGVMGCIAVKLHIDGFIGHGTLSKQGVHLNSL